MSQSAKQATVFDSEKQQLGDIYAKALLGFGQTINNVDGLVEGLENVVEVINAVPGMRAALESPRIALVDKSKLLDKAFASKVDKELLNFLKLVGSKNRFDCLAAISVAAKKLQDELAGRVEATLISATEVDESVKNRIAEQLGKVIGKQVRLQTEVDGTILGGMVVRVGDTVYDGSVVNQLAQVRSQAIQRASDAIREQLERFAVSS